MTRLDALSFLAALAIAAGQLRSWERYMEEIERTVRREWR